MKECKHGLLAASCFDCTPRPRARKAVAERSHLFSARWDTYCRQCREDIPAGDEVGWIDDEIACTDCLED